MSVIEIADSSFLFLEMVILSELTIIAGINSTVFLPIKELRGVAFVSLGADLISTILTLPSISIWEMLNKLWKRTSIQYFLSLSSTLHVFSEPGFKKFLQKDVLLAHEWIKCSLDNRLASVLSDFKKMKEIKPLSHLYQYPLS